MERERTGNELSRGKRRRKDFEKKEKEDSK